MTPQQFYRYQIVEYAQHDYDGELCKPAFPSPTVVLRTYDLMGETNKGYWIGYKNFLNWKKWIPKTSKKRYAYPTKEQALDNFIKRTARRIKILEWQLDVCNIAVSRAKQMEIKGVK